MVSPMNGRAELRDDKVITPFGDLAPRPDIRPEVLLRLSGKLQTTLELSQLLEIFLEEIQQAVLIDGLSFHHEPSNTSIAVGRNSLHTANYRLQTQQDYMGDIAFHRSTRFREHELANIEGLMTALVYPMRNALRYHEALAAAFRDPLTGAGNRVALDKTLNREIELAKRHDQALSILMLDLDHFKRVNDEFGHSMGDKVLKEAVNAMAGCIRQTDMCFRYGGEEFAVVLAGVDIIDAAIVAERIREAMRDPPFVVGTTSRTVTCSLGVATFGMGETAMGVVAAADGALYRAKHAGKDRVEQAGA